MEPDLDSDPAINVIDLQDANKKLIKKKFSAYYFLKVHLLFLLDDIRFREAQKHVDPDPEQC
jgi:hypothetical protein